MLKTWLVTTLLFGATAFAATQPVRLGSRIFDAQHNDDLGDPGNTDGHSVMIDLPQDACGLHAIAVMVEGAPAWIWNVRVSYRASHVTRATLPYNRVVQDGAATPWLALPNNGLCVRRLTVRSQSGAGDVPIRLTVFGQ
jgi:hypothetical protein